eukprot:gene13343-9175_t
MSSHSNALAGPSGKVHSSPRTPLVPLDILRHTRGQTVSVELTSGETVNGSVVRTDRAMNIVLKIATRTSADGESFWRSREVLVRGASIKTVRMDPKALRPPPPKARTVGTARRTRDKDVKADTHPQRSQQEHGPSNPPRGATR